MKNIFVIILLLVISQSACSGDVRLSKQDKADMFQAGEIVNYIHSIRLKREKCLSLSLDIKDKVYNIYNSSKIIQFSQLTPAAVPYDNDELSKIFEARGSSNISNEEISKCFEELKASLLVFDSNAKKYKALIERYLRVVSPKLDRLLDSKGLKKDREVSK